MKYKRKNSVKNIKNKNKIPLKIKRELQTLIKHWIKSKKKFNSKKDAVKIIKSIKQKCK